MAAILLILLFVYMHNVAANSILGCDSAEKENDMIIDTVRSKQNATTINFITNYHASSPEDCFEDCCRRDSCNIATYRYAKSELISQKNCLHITCLPLDVCVYRESNKTITAKLYRSDNKTDIDNLDLEDRSKNREWNHTEFEYTYDDNLSHTNISENLTQKMLMDNSSVLLLNQNLENSSDIQMQLEVNKSVVPDLKTFEKFFSKFTKINSPISFEVTPIANQLSSQQLGSKPSVKKQLQTSPSLNTSSTTSKENGKQAGEDAKWEIPPENTFVLIPITPKILPFHMDDAKASKIIPFQIDDSKAYRRPVNQSVSSKKEPTENFIRTKKELSEKILLIIVASMGVATVVIVAVLIGRHFLDTWQRRHYSKMDYLVDGMYNWNDDKE